MSWSYKPKPCDCMKKKEKKKELLRQAREIIMDTEMKISFNFINEGQFQRVKNLIRQIKTLADENEDIMLID